MITIRRPLTSAAAIATTVVGISVFGTAPAQAHSSCIDRTWGAACVSSDHHGVSVADWLCDGHEVRVELRFTNGTSARVYDPDGCGRGFGGEGYVRYVSSYQLCAVGIGCTAWKAA